MPSGKTHYNFYKAGFLVEIPEFAYLFTLNKIIALSHLVGYFIHRWADNDWDIMGVNKSESRVVKELPILGYFIFAISSFYGAVFRHKHRSFLTHFPIVSTVIRLGFIFFWIPPLYYFGVLDYQQWHSQVFWGVLWGLSQADMEHWLADIFWSESYFDVKKRK